MANVKQNAQAAAQAAKETAQTEDILLWGTIIALILYPVVLWWQRKNNDSYIGIAVSIVGVVFSFAAVGFLREWYDNYRAKQDQITNGQSVS